MQDILLLITLIALVISLVLIIIPSVPVAALTWAIILIYGAFTGFTRLTPLALVLITVGMILGSTSGFWMPFFGLRGRQFSCLGLFAFFVGMSLGTMLIPIPVIGSLLGGLAGVVLIELAQVRQVGAALKSGGTALRMIVYSMLAELGFALFNVAIFLVALLTTG